MRRATNLPAFLASPSGTLAPARGVVMTGGGSAKSSTFWSQMSMAIMYVLIVVCIGYLFQLVLQFEKHTDDEMVDSYLLKQQSLSLLQLGSRPKLWIPFFTDQNRAQSGNYLHSFLDRTPQPGEVQLQILQLTLRTIERHNNDFFQIVLVDDSTFTSLIPSWSQHGVQLESARVSEGVKKHLRELGLLMLLYLHGGMVVPASLICTSSLKDTYLEFTNEGLKPFFSESTQGGMSTKPVPAMRIMGAPAGHYLLRDLMEHLVYQRFPTTDRNHVVFPYVAHVRNAADRHFEHAETFKPLVGPYLRSKGEEGSRECNVIPGEFFGVCTVGTRTNPSRPIDVDQWFMKKSDRISLLYSSVESVREDRVRALDYPHEAALDSKKHNWIARANQYKILNSGTMLSMHLQFALTDTTTKNEAEIMSTSPVL
jgi:hypothetical protein